MADTVKKSRIVSEHGECLASAGDFGDEDTSLQDIINEEFNQRLKSCMRNEQFLEANQEHIALTYEPGEVLKNGDHKAQITPLEPTQVQEQPEEEPTLDLTLQTIQTTDLDTTPVLSSKEVLNTESLAEETEVNGRQEIEQEKGLPPQQTPPEATTDTSTNGLDHLNHPEVEQFDTFINKEVPSPEEDPDVPFDNITVTDVDNEALNAKERFLSTVQDLQELSTIKDRMLLSTDSACLLFTQTVIQSPMLTPTDENYDFLSAIQQQNPPEEVSTENLEDVSEISAENEVCNKLESSNSEELSEEHEDIKEITVKFIQNEVEVSSFKPTPTIVEHLVEDIDPDNDDIIEDYSLPPAKSEEEASSKVSEISKKFSSKDSEDSNYSKEEEKSPVLEETFEDIKKTKEIFEKISEEPTLPKSSDLIKKLSDSSPESDTALCDTNSVCPNVVSSTITTESSFVETRTETNSNQDKVLKKKKSKKSKKDNEKENISVCDTNTNDEDNLSHVSVKNLCRSFSDLTSIGSKKAEAKLKTRIAYGRTKSMSDIRREDVNLENVFSNVSVKSLKSSFSKFDALQKKTVLHVRSSDSGKAQEKFNGTTQIDTSSCKSCGKQVFQMEQMKAEKAIWHKNCFRCNECNKQLNVDTYQSNEGVLYCKPHFKALFTPKAVEDEPQPMRPRKHEMIIRENQPLELPPDVVRASDKPDLGLEELQNLNVKERFQVFENHENQENSLERTPSTVNVKRSPSILSKLAKFQSKGMDIGVADDSLNGVPVEESSSEEEEEEEEIEGEDAELVRARRAQREKPMHFSNMSDVMSKWESGNQMTKEERREERKQEIQSIRSRLFMGKQAKIKEMYQQAVLDSSSGAHVRKQVPLDAELSESARSLRERFERGEQLTSAEQQTLTDLDDADVFESGISKKSRSIFLELDANASKPPSLKVVSPGKGEVRRAREAFMARQASEDVVKASDQVDDVEVKTADISSRFKFFETYKEPEKQRKQFRITPPRDGQLQPQPDSPDAAPAAPVEADDTQEATAAHTATRMLSVFRQMEESAGKEQTPAGPKPLKRFTPPPEPQRPESDSGEDYSDEEDDDEEEQRVVDEDLLEAQKAARAKQLRAKFEKWEANEIKREQNNSSVNIAEEMADADSQIESAKSLRARFESMRETTTDKERTPRVKVNRFVDTTNNVETCKSCEGRVYPLEKVSCHNNVYHKNCFRCRECNAILRMDSYTYNQGLLYCMPHFKRLFISKGNYEAGFGLDQHKEKWNTVA